ncbi:MAG: NifU family protein [Ignavibacteriae bacterium]|nr:MAG: NifU family protein [Ignavibacteriota bacterium]
MENLAEVINKIQLVLEHIRPFLQIDGGDVELVRVTDDGIAEVKFLGSCTNCAMSPMTLRAGIERAIMHEVPEIKRIESVH